jgi:hypothetical protein
VQVLAFVPVHVEQAQGRADAQHAHQQQPDDEVAPPGPGETGWCGSRFVLGWDGLVCCGCFAGLGWRLLLGIAHEFHREMSGRRALRMGLRLASGACRSSGIVPQGAFACKRGGRSR